MSDEAKNEERPHPQFIHTHKLSFQKDDDFAEESGRLLQYLVGAQFAIPCVHQDHPSVHAVEVMVGGLTLGLPREMAQAVEVMAHVFFAAGQQYAVDQKISDAHPQFVPQEDLSRPGQTMDEWRKMHRANTTEWREDIRGRFYQPPKKQTLGDLLAHIAEAHGDEIDISDIGEEDLLARLLGHQRQPPPDTGMYL